MIKLDDYELKFDAYSKTCIKCKHLKTLKLHICDAFKDGIPLEIWNGHNDHTSPYSGDNGIMFEHF